MAANEAPEKIYINGFSAFATVPVKESIEYTRTDAFMEKACDAYCKVCKMPNCRRNDCKMLSVFKGYL